MSKSEIDVIFGGKVQGVFFRATVKNHAEDLNIKGFVRNLPDGSVEMKAIGEEKRLKKLIENIKQNPGAAEIKDIVIKPSSITKNYETFLIL